MDICTRKWSLPRIAACLALVLLPLGAGHGADGPGSPPGATVQELLDWVDRHNPELAALQHESEAAAARVQPAGALSDPALRMEFRDITNGNRSNPNLLPGRVESVKYTVLQPVPFWGKRDLRREVAEAEFDQAKGRRRSAAALLHARVKTAFAQYYLARHGAEVTSEILELARDLERVARTRYAAGLVPQQDVIKAQLEQTALRSELIALEAEQRQARARLNAVLGRPGDAPLAEPRELRPLPPAAALERAALEQRIRQANPQLVTQSAEITAAETGRKLAEKNRYPDFILGLAPIQRDSGVREWEVMVEFNIPLQQETRRSQRSEAAFLLAAARERRQATANLVLGELQESLAGLEAARQQEDLLKNSLLPQAELTFKAALAGYQTGKVDFATLLDAQRQINRARHDLLAAQVAQQIRLAEIERLTGEEL
jgi:outer membrane protein TolC